jgi:Holliday junction resolvasome RuvABC endonuclease subunit
MLLLLDPAYSNIGYALMHEGKVVTVGNISPTPSTTKQNYEIDKNYLHVTTMANELNDIIENYDPQGIIFEADTGSQNARAAKCLGFAFGVVWTLRAIWGIPFERWFPRDVKVELTGNNKASKMEMMEAIANHFGWTKEVKNQRVTFYVTIGIDNSVLKISKAKFEHIADALALYWISSRKGNLYNMYGR